MSQTWNLPILGTDSAHVALKTKVSDACESLRTNFSGATAPSLTVPYQFWMDTTTGILKQRNAGNTAWVTIWPGEFELQRDIGASVSATTTKKLGIARRAGTVSQLLLSCDTASTSSSGNEWRFQVTKYPNSAPGSPVSCISANVGTFTALGGVGGGAEFVAHKVLALTPNQNLTVALNDELEVTGTTLVNLQAQLVIV